MLAMMAMQGLGLGLGRKTGAATGSLEGELQVASLLNDPIFSANQEGLITDFRVGGQSLMCSDLGVGWRVFHLAAQLEGQRAIGLPVRAKTLVTASYSLAAAGTIWGAVGTDPIPPEEAKDANDPTVSTRLNYVFGLGKVTVPNGAAATINAVCRRSGTLGALVLYSPSAAAYDDIEVRNVERNNATVFAGRVAGATTDPMPLGYFDYLRTDTDGRMLNLEVAFNDNLTITLFNNNAAPLDVYGGILVLPE